MSASKVIALTKQRKQSEHGIRMSRQAIQVAALLGAHLPEGHEDACLVLHHALENQKTGLHQ
jgi:hypothetical protein